MGLNCESISTTSKLYTPNVKLTNGATENGAQMVGTDEFITRNYNIWRNGYQGVFEQQ